MANGFSAILNAPVVALPAFVLVVWMGAGERLAEITLSLVFATAWPLLGLVILSRLGVTSDVYVADRRERVIPFIVAISGYLLGGAALWSIHASTPVLILMLTYAGNTVSFLILSLRWKPSVHACGVTGPASALTFLFGFPGLWFLVLLPPVAWARIRLGAHTWREVYAGALVTVPLTFFQFAAYSKLI